jgi:cysteine synthase B
MVKQLQINEQMLVGPSSGSVMASMLKIAEELDSGLIVGIFADDGRKFKSLYTQQNLFTEKEYDNALKNAINLPEIAYSFSDYNKN